MRRVLVGCAAAIALAATGTHARAGIYSDELAKCVVSASTPKDQLELVEWIFSAISAHPSVQAYSKISDADRQAFNKKTASLFDRLLTQDCRAQTVNALKYEGSGAVESSFGVLGQVAVRNLMTDANVQKSISGLSDYFDKSKLDAIAKEAGVPNDNRSTPSGK